MDFALVYILYCRIVLALDSSKYNHITDAELLEKYYADSNNEWLGILLQRYTLLLFGVSMKYLKNEEEAKDAVQHVFTKVVQEVKRYKVSYFKSWLYMIAKNHCLMKLRDKGKYNAELNEQRTAAMADESNRTEAIEKEEQLNLLEKAMPLLNKEQRDCINLFYLEKLSYSQISEQTGYSQMQVKSHIQNGKRNLKLLMQRMQQNG